MDRRRGGRRIGRVSILATALLVGSTLLFLAQPISAAPTTHPVYVWTPPFAGNVQVSTGNGGVSCPSDNYTLATPGFFNITTGEFGVAQRTAVTNSSCSYAVEAATYLVQYVFFFNSTVNGPHVFRTFWFLNWEVSLQTTLPHPEKNLHSQARSSMSITEEIWDVTTNPGTSVYASYARSASVTGNVSKAFSHNIALSLPLNAPYVLTKGDEYKVFLQIAFGIGAYVYGYGNSAVVNLSIGNATHPTRLEKIQFW